MSLEIMGREPQPEGTYNARWMLAVVSAHRLARATKQRVKVYMRNGRPCMISTSLPIGKRST